MDLPRDNISMRITGINCSNKKKNGKESATQAKTASRQSEAMISYLNKKLSKGLK